MNISEYKDILVYIEQREGTIESVSIELISKARELAQKSNQQVIAFVPGHDITDAHVNECMLYGADKVYIANHHLLKDYITETYTKVSVQLIEMIKPESVLIGATTIGRDLAPRISARIATGLTADCTSLEICPETSHLLMTRPAFGGNIMATIICPVHRPQISTVRPGVMHKVKLAETPKLNVQYIDANLSQNDINIEILETTKEKTVRKNIAEAKVLVSAGRGVGKEENLQKLHAVAEKLGGMVSGSRAVVDNGWLDHSLQVGQTGQTVRPEVYIACGISGAIQHVAGMEESSCIIAINKNPTAPILQIADLGIIGDVNQILPAVADLLDTTAS
jgi:electron transfer flavoprotein alpha subunit